MLDAPFGRRRSNQEFYFEHIKCTLKRDVKRAVAFKSLEFREKVGAGDVTVRVINLFKGI